MTRHAEALEAVLWSFGFHTSVTDVHIQVTALLVGSLWLPPQCAVIGRVPSILPASQSR